MKNDRKISCFIVDDERPAREVLSNYLTQYCPEIRISGQADSVSNAAKLIKDEIPDVVFLDIEMPGGNGFELLRKYDPIPFKTIFVTAYSQYAADAFRFAAVDYLLKPIKISELIGTVNKVQREMNEHRALQTMLSLLESALLNSASIKQLVVTDTKGFSVVRTSEIIMLQADGYCTQIFITGNEPVLSSRNLKYFEDILNDRTFMRVHHSYLINLDHVKGYTHQEEIILSNKIYCPLSRVHKKHFIEHYKGKKT